MLLLVVSNNFDLTVVGNAEAPADTSDLSSFVRILVITDSATSSY